MKMIAGACWRACSNRSRTRAAPTPTNISTNSEPEIEKNGTPASPATARASNVLPVPGGPTSSTPFGGRPPSRPYRDRVLQEIDDLDQLVLGLVDAGDIGEGDLGLLLDIDPGAALADLHQPAEPALPHAPDREHPDPDKKDRRQDPGQEIAQPVALDDPAIGDAVLVQALGEVGIDPRRDEVLDPVGLRLLQRAADVILGDRDLGDLVFVEQASESGCTGSASAWCSPDRGPG